MALKFFEKYCKRCGYVFLNDTDVPDDEDVLMIGCDNCDSIKYIHRCKDGTYAEMGIREVHAHEHDDNKAKYEKAVK